VPVGYDELSKEQYIGGVYLREFLRAPQSQLRSTEKFVEVRSQANTSKHKHKQYLSCARLGMSILKPINLPRQARDKHREGTQKALPLVLATTVCIGINGGALGACGCQVEKRSF
jgi:hypothetical protein